jgi:hypothetical protein
MAKITDILGLNNKHSDNQNTSNPDYIISVWTNETPHITKK